MIRRQQLLGLALSTSLIAVGGSARADEKSLAAAVAAGVTLRSGDAQIKQLKAANGLRGAASTGGTGSTGSITVDESGVPNIDSLVNFTGSFTQPGFDFQGKAQSTWAYSMIGHSPRSQEPTLLGAP